MGQRHFLDEVISRAPASGDTEGGRKGHLGGLLGRGRGREGGRRVAPLPGRTPRSAARRQANTAPPLWRGRLRSVSHTPAPCDPNRSTDLGEQKEKQTLGATCLPEVKTERGGRKEVGGTAAGPWSVGLGTGAF